MEALETTQNNFTEDEKALAERYQVEPKTVRLIAEIASERTSEQAQPEDVEDTETEGPEADSESEFQEKRFQDCLDDIQKSVSSYPVECRPELLAAALEQATKGKGAAEKIVEIKQEIYRVCDSLLDPKAKATLALLSELSSLSGITNVGVDFATNILHSTFGQKDVKQALEQFPDDNDVAFLSYVFGLAHPVVKADDKIFLQKVSEQAETIERPQAAELEDAEAGPNTGIKALDEFLERLSYEAKVAAYGALRLVCVSEDTGKKMREYFRKEVAFLDDPENAEKQTCMDHQTWSGCTWFLGFVRGAQIGLEEC